MSAGAAVQGGTRRDGKQRKKRESIEQLELLGSREFSMHRSEKGSYGFNLRGTAGVAGADRQRGQYIRSVDFGSTAHTAGLRSGDRVIEVNGERCDDESHEEVIHRIKSAPSPLKMTVVRDPGMKAHAKKVTKTLLGEANTVILNDRTNIPHFTVEMTETPLGRTKMLKERLSGLKFAPPAAPNFPQEDGDSRDRADAKTGVWC